MFLILQLGEAAIGRFGRDQHSHLMRQFFHIHQTTSVTEYIEHFDTLVHQLLAYDPSLGQPFLTSRFVDGLKNEIRAVVLVHRPKDLDTASSLALLQEDSLQLMPRREWKKSEGAMCSNSVVSTPAVKQATRTMALPLPTPPAGVVSSHSQAVNTSGGSQGKKLEDKMSAMKAYRRANGLCYKCGKK